MFSLGSASPLAGQGEPGLADNGPSETIPLELPWKAHSLAEDLSRDIAEPAQPLQVHNGSSWVTFWDQGGGKWQGEGSVENREDERWEQGKG